MTVVGSAVLELKGDTSDFVRKMDGASLKLRQTASGFDRAGGGIRNVAQSLLAVGQKVALVAAPLAAAGAAALGFATNTARAARELLNMSEATGLSTRSIQEYRHVARAVGADQDVIADAARGLTERLRAVGTESKEVADVLNALGVNVRDSDGRLRSMGAVLPEIIGKLQGLGNGTERNALAMRLFGERAAQLAPVLGLTAGEFANMQEEARELGLVLSEDALRSAAEFQRGFAAIGGVVSNTAQRIGLVFLPLLAKLVSGTQSALTATQRAWREWSQQISLTTRATVNVVSDYLDRLWNFIRPTFQAIVDASRAAWRLTLQPIIDFVRQATHWLVDRFGDSVGSMADMLERLVENINPVLGLAFRAVRKFVDDVQAEMVRLDSIWDHAEDGIIAFNRTLADGFTGSRIVVQGLGSDLDDIAKRVRAITGFSEAGPLLGDPRIVGDPNRRTGPFSDRPGSGNFGGMAGAVSARSTAQNLTANAPGFGFLDRIKEGFGKLGELVQGFLPSLSAVSIGFAFLAPIIKGIGEVLRPTIEALLEPLVEVGRVLGGIIKPVLDALKAPLQALAKLITVLLEPFRVFVDLLVAFELPLKILSAVFRVLTIAVSYLQEAIGFVIEALGRFVDSIVPDFISTVGKGLAQAGRDLQERARAVRNGTDAEDDSARAAKEAATEAARLAKNAGQAAGAVREFASATTSVPQGFRVNDLNLARFNATVAETAGSLLARMGGNRITALNGLTAAPAGAVTSGGHNFYQTFEIYQQAGENGEQFANRVAEIMETRAVHKNLTDGKTAQDAWAPR